MKYVTESFLAKSFHELQDVLVLKEYNNSFIKNHILDPYFRFNTFIPEGKLYILGIEIEHSTISFVACKCSNIIALLAIDQAIKVTLLLHYFFPDNFRFVSKDDPIHLNNRVSSKSFKRNFVEFEIKHKLFDINKKFHISPFANYSFISAFLHNYRIL